MIVVYLVSGRRVGGKLSVMEASLEYHVVLHRAGGASALDNGSSKQAVLATEWRRSLSPQQETYLYEIRQGGGGELSVMERSLEKHVVPHIEGCSGVWLCARRGC